MTTNTTILTADDEKKTAAMSSVIAAIGLTTFKIIVGVMTNSLGILAEAAHSGLDLVAALATFLAVRISGKPADQKHPYGHGKVENLSALFETLLLLATSAWIIFESIQRLTAESVKVDASIWAFIVMATSIIVDFTRSRILYKTARKHNSQALEADALHFSTDIWSSTVVILGLVGVRLASQFTSLQFLHKADAIAALGVALIVIYVSLNMGIRTIHGLIDQVPEELPEKISKAIIAIPGIENVHQVRVRPSGPSYFVDVHVVVDGNLHLTEAHQLTTQVDKVVKQLIPQCDITVHAEPSSSSD